MFIQIGSNKFNVLNLYTSTDAYTVRISKEFENEIDDGLGKSLDITIQDCETSYIIRGYDIRGKVIWDKFIDYTIALETNAVIITKTELDSLNEQITNLEIALCEIYESQEV